MSWKRKTLLSNCLTPSYYTFNGIELDHKTLPIKRISENYLQSQKARISSLSLLVLFDFDVDYIIIFLFDHQENSYQPKPFDYFLDSLLILIDKAQPIQMTHLFEISLEQNKCEAQRKKLSNSFEQSTTNLQISNVCCNCKTLISEKCDG